MRARHKVQFASKLAAFRAGAAVEANMPPTGGEGAVSEMDLSHQQLTAAPNLSAFSALLRVRLNNNAIATLAGCGLEAAKQVRVLDLRDNQLELFSSSQQSHLVRIVNAMPALVFLGVSGNKRGCMARGELWQKLMFKMASRRYNARGREGCVCSATARLYSHRLFITTTKRP